MIVSAALDGAHAMAAYQNGFLSSVRPATAIESLCLPSTLPVYGQISIPHAMQPKSPALLS